MRLKLSLIPRLLLGIEYGLDDLKDILPKIDAGGLCGAIDSSACIGELAVASAPADRTNPSPSSSARLVAKRSVLLEAWCADHGLACTACVGALLARDADVVHSVRAVWGTNTAAKGREPSSALGVPEKCNV